MPSPSNCLCGSDEFTRVTVRQKSGELYTTEFVSCRACGVMYHRPDLAKPIEAMTPSAATTCAGSAG
jgi:hypothetical protein